MNTSRCIQSRAPTNNSPLSSFRPLLKLILALSVRPAGTNESKDSLRSIGLSQELGTAKKRIGGDRNKYWEQAIDRYETGRSVDGRRIEEKEEREREGVRQKGERERERERERQREGIRHILLAGKRI